MQRNLDKPLHEDLVFIKDKTRWGFIFRRGLFEIEKNDYIRIASAMNVESF